MHDADTINAIRDGDEAKINEIINQYSKLMWSIASAILKHVGTVEDIEECVADVFVYLWENPAKYNPERGTLKSFLAIVARSKATDKYRQLSRQMVLPLDDRLLSDTLELTDTLLSQETKRALIAAITSLTELDRDIIVRRYYHEEKPKEIAFALDISVKQVENRLYRTKLRLKELLS